MKISHGLVLVLPLVLLISGCAKKDEGTHSKTSDGRCTQAFIDSYNLVGKTHDLVKFSYSRANKIAALRELRQACADLFAQHPNVSCRAIREKSGAENQVSTTERSQMCEDAKTELLVLEREENPGRSESVPAPVYSEN